MDDRARTLASAVVIPDPPSQPASRSPTPTQSHHVAPNGHAHQDPQVPSLKRRASTSNPYDDTTNQDPYAKRARLTSAFDAPRSTAAQRKRPSEHAGEADRKRGRRLFGSLLGTLAQAAPSNAAQQRRAEVERKQRAKLAASAVADTSSAPSTLTDTNPSTEAEARGAREVPGNRVRTAEELMQLKARRAKLGRRVEVEALGARHAAMRARAGFLRTGGEPRVYWRPFELRAEEEEKIARQREEVEQDIVAENAAAKDRWEKEDIEKGEESKGEGHGEGGEREDLTDETGHEHAPTVGQEGDAATMAGSGLGDAQDKEDEGKDNGDDDEDMVMNRDAEEDPVLCHLPGSYGAYHEFLASALLYKTTLRTNVAMTSQVWPFPETEPIVNKYEDAEHGNGQASWAIYVGYKVSEEEEAEIMEYLMDDLDEDDYDFEIFELVDRTDKGLTEIYNDHIRILDSPDITEPCELPHHYDIFGVVEDSQWRTKGILLVNLCNLDGKVDALRCPAAEVNVVLFNLFIANMDWEEFKDMAEIGDWKRTYGCEPFPPRPAFSPLFARIILAHPALATCTPQGGTMAELSASGKETDLPHSNGGASSTNHPQNQDQARPGPPTDKRGWDGKLRVGKAAEQYEAEHMDGPTPPDSEDDNEDDQSENEDTGHASTAATTPAPSILDTANGRQVTTRVEDGPTPTTIEADEDLLSAYPVDETEIDLNHSRITSITSLALERFGQLQRLCLRQNQIPSIHFPPASAWQSTATLTELDLYDNAIAHIKGLDDLTNLETLDLSFNSIKHIKRLSHLHKLKDLFFVQNRIVKIENLEGLGELTNLELGGNRIREIENLEAVPKLTQLWLGKNKIAELKNLESLQHLTLISIQSNRLTSPSLSHLATLPHLTELYLSHNLINSLKGLEDCVHMTTLDISFNPVTSLQGIGKMKDLEEFWASGCRLDDFEEIEKELGDKESLETVYFESNPLQLRQPAVYRNKVRLRLPHVKQIDATFVRV
ncbi:hypothetical protein FH972_023816 [Carpinus fangiana]|uniref:U2A'/phosphoprotein 32 family A C-terminal domain-containing protein n=1 Tax=Carpinus fangiana TaxID=176857 RepID=A0A5N6KX21_9ROSI|nr:hypothetical protein FH972_023816 [Carpinus fangiana]